MNRLNRWIVAALAGMLAAAMLTSPAHALTAAPKYFKVTRVTPTTVSLDWLHVANAPQYRVRYATKKDMTDASTIHFTKSLGTVKNLKPSTNYWFQVRVVSKTGKTLISYYTKTPLLKRTPDVPPPTALASTSRTSTAIGLSWTASEGAVEYELDQSDDAGFASFDTKVFKTNDVTITSLTPKSNYWFRVRAVTPQNSETGDSTSLPVTTMERGETEPDVDVDLRVANFNIFDISADKYATGNQKPWVARKPEVAGDIVDSNADVVGLQEANQSVTYYPANSEMTQYLDLRNAVNARGVKYALVNTKNYNCENYISSASCIEKDQGASRGVRILYNTATLALQQQGSHKYRSQTGTVDRYLAWATFRVKANGRVFLFVTTHLQPFDTSTQRATRIAQWDELISWVKAKQAALDNPPVAITGDFNTTKNTDYAARLVPAMKVAGFGDVLNQEFNENPIASPRAETRVNGWINSRNGWSSSVKGNTDEGEPWTFWEERDDPLATQRTGNNIDWIFASNELRVKEWKVVVRYNHTDLKITRTIPSDHNMVRATMVLPPPV